MRTRALVLLAILAVLATTVFVVLPPVHQDESYHSFFDRRTLLGVPNFWNVMSNAAFLIAGIGGFRALRSPEAFGQNWERLAYVLLLAGVALTAAGSAYYHWHPDSQTLVWDRLPMTLAFLALFTTTIGERIDMRLGPILLAPFLILGVLSVVYWKSIGDLRPYGLVQFLPMIAIPAMLLLFPPRYTHSATVWGMAALYILAKAVELWDRPIGRVVSTGGHPWKHVLAAMAIGCYASGVARRKAEARPII